MIPRLFGKIREKRGTFTVYVILCLITAGVIAYSAVTSKWTECFYGFMTLLLFFLPAFLEEKWEMEFSSVLEAGIMLFIFSAEILGEAGRFYAKFPFWDNMLHWVNGLLFGAFGFALADLMNRKRKISGKLSPLFLAVVACCFSVTIGVFWEFFEFSMDRLTVSDMQKDSFLASVVSGKLSADGQTPIAVKEILRTTVQTKDGKTYVFENGYLDIGLTDTMKDLFVDFIGSLGISVLGYFSLSYQEKKNSRSGAGKLVARVSEKLIPVVKKSPEPEEFSPTGEQKD